MTGGREKGMAGEKGTKEVFRCISGRCFGKKNPRRTPECGGIGRFHDDFHFP